MNLNDLDNVNLDFLLHNQALRYNSNEHMWKNDNIHIDNEYILYDANTRSTYLYDEILDAGNISLSGNDSRLIKCIQNQDLSNINITFNNDQPCYIACIRLEYPMNWNEQTSILMSFETSTSQSITFTFDKSLNNTRYDYILWIKNRNETEKCNILINKISCDPLMKPNFIIFNLSNTSSILNISSIEENNKNYKIYDQITNTWNERSNVHNIACSIAKRLFNNYNNLSIGIVNCNIENLDNQSMLLEYKKLIDSVISNSNTDKINLILTDTFDNDTVYYWNMLNNNYNAFINELSTHNIHITNFVYSKPDNYLQMNNFNNLNMHLTNVYNNYNVLDVGKYNKISIKTMNKISEEILYNYAKFRNNLESSNVFTSYPQDFLNQFNNETDNTYIPLNDYLNKIKVVKIHTNTSTEFGTHSSGEEMVKSCNYSNIKISPSGNLMFVNSQLGSTFCYTRNQNSWDYYGVIHTLGNLRLGWSANGLLGLILCENFDENSENENFRKIFLTYTIHYEGDSIPTNMISSLIYNYNPVTNVHSLDNRNDIWTFNQYFGYAHQVMDGYCHNNKLYVVVGDQVVQSAPQDDTTDAGKIICMDYDGNNKKHVAKGIRDPYGGPIRLPSNIDNLERTAWVGNGNDNARACLARIDDSLPVLNCGWEGNDSETFLNVPDTNHILPLKPNIVTYSWKDADPSPNGLAMYTLDNPFIQSNEYLNTCIPKSIVPQSRTVGFASFFGGNLPSSYNRTIGFHIIENLGNVVSSETIPFLILNGYNDNEPLTYDNAPLRLEIDPIDGQLLFIDIFSSSIYKVFFNRL